MAFENKGSRPVKRAAVTLLLTLSFIVSSTAVFADSQTSSANPSGTVAAASATTTASTPLFSDVGTGFWAEKHIYKLAAEGILLGDKGKFRPNDPVTQQEVIKIAVAFMNKSDKLVDGAKPSINLGSAAYFQPYVALALQEQLIDGKEELAATGAKETWGTKKASREWIAKVLVRALGKEADAKAAGGKGTTFSDNATISASGRGYVSVAVDLGITNGVEGNRFDPLGTVTRSQAATFFSRGQAFVNPGYSNVSEGIVTAYGNGKISLYTGESNQSFVLDNNTVYFSKDSEKRASQNDVALYSKAMVIDKAGSAAYVEIIDPTPQLETIEGTLLRVLSGNKLLLLVNNNAETYTYDDSTSFLNQNGTTIKASDLTNESTIVLKRETFTKDKKPVLVQVKSGIVNKTSTGTVESVDPKTKTVSVKETSGNVDKLVLDGTAKILYQGQVMDLTELKAGSVVNYTIKDNVVISVEVTQSVERTVTGKLINLGDKLLTYQKSDNNYATLPLSQDANVVISGIAAAKITDLIADENGGDNVQLTLNGEGAIAKIEVLNRRSEQLNEVSVVQYDKTKKLLYLVDAKDNPYALTLDASTKVDYNTVSPTLAGLESLLNSGRKVTITHIGKRVLSISVIYQYEGSFVSVDNANKKLKLQMTDGTTRELAYTNTQLPVTIYGKASGTLADLKAGDSIVAQLNAAQDAVSGILVKTAKQFEIVSVDTNTNRITAKGNGVSQSFYVDQAVLLDANGTAIKVSALSTGNYINVLFNGTVASTAQVVTNTYGAVTNVSASSFTVKGSGGTSTTFPAPAKVKVIRGASTSTTLSSLTTADHVAVRKDADGTMMVTVLTSLNRDFWRYDANSKVVYVKKETLSDMNTSFSLPVNAFIHQGDNTLTVQSLQENDTIVLYFDGDRLVEIEKQ